MEATSSGHRLVAIAEEECWRLAASRPFGHLGVVVDGQPEVFPMDHRVVDRTLLVRTEDGTKLRAAAGARVGYEVDDVDDATRGGWSVMVAGYADEVFDLTDLAPIDDADVPLWTGGPVHWLRIVPARVTGRRLVRATPAP